MMSVKGWARRLVYLALGYITWQLVQEARILLDQPWADLNPEAEIPPWVNDGRNVLVGGSPWPEWN